MFGLFKFRNFEKNFRFFMPFSFACMMIFSIFALNAIIQSPDDYQQGNAVKMMYVHVPAAWMGMLIYTLMAVFNVSGFVWKNPYFYVISKVIAPIGLIFTLITLVTGSIWGKPIWGTWWVWDARLTSVLILFFLYLGYIILIDSFDVVASLKPWLKPEMNAGCLSFTFTGKMRFPASAYTCA